MKLSKVTEFINIYILGKGIIKSPVIQKYQPFVLPVLSVVFCLLLLILVTIPQLLKLLETFKTLDGINRTQSVLNTKLSALKTINQEEYNTDLDTALIALPPEKDVPGAVDQILIMLAGSGLHLDGISFDNSSDRTVPIENYAVRMTVSGDINQLKTLFDKTKDSPRIIKINSIETGTGPTNALGATISLLVFYRPLPASVNTDSPTVPLITDSDIKLLERIKLNASTIPTLSQLDVSSIPTGKADPFN